MLHELQAVLKPKKKLDAVINVTATTIQTTLKNYGNLIPNLVGARAITGNLAFPHVLIDSEGYTLIDSKGYTLLSSEHERSEE